MADMIGKREFMTSIGNLTLYLVFEKPVPSRTPDYSCMTPHSHPHFQLYVCGKGSFSIETPVGELDLYEGDALLLPPRYQHRISDCRAETEWYSAGYAYSLRQRYEKGELYSLIDGFCRQDLVRKYDSDMGVYEEVRRLAELPETVSEYLPAVGMIRLLSLLAEKEPFDLEIGENEEKLRQQTEMMNILTYLDYIICYRFAETVTQAELAGRLYISERQLSRIAKKRYGMTLHNAINDKRVTTAARLLETTEETAEKIGQSVGFVSKICFYREFKRKYGMTPYEYRKKNR